MSWRRQLSKVGGLFGRPKPVDDDLEEEIRSHLQMEEEENLESGLLPEEAHYAALRRFGNVTLAHERSREMWGWHSVETLLQDLRYGLRQLRRSPGFTIVAVLTLALGIGANTSMFSVVNAVLLRPLPYPEPDRIVRISLIYRGQVENDNFNAKQFDFWKSHSDPLQDLAATTEVGFNLGGVSRPERVRALRVSTGYFHVLGVRPAVGREFLANEDWLGAPNTAILSHGLWVRDFGADPRVVGHSVRLDGTPFTVIGVMPPGFESTSPVDLWTTIGQVAQSIGGGGNYEVIARLKPGVSVKSANSYLATLTRPYFQEFDPQHEVSEKILPQVSFAVFPYNYMITIQERTPLLVLFGAIGFVLLIACVNVANLQMARAVTRRHEITVRAAMGAGRLRILRQLLTESVLLGLVGAAAGLLLAYWGLHSLLALTPTDLPHAQRIFLDTWALGFTVLVALLAGILFGIAPALHASKPDLAGPAKEGGGRGSSRRHRLGSALVTTEVALSLVLLVGSGLLIKTSANLLRTNLGFDPQNVLSVPIWTTGTQYKSGAGLASFYETALRRIEAIPGVQSAAVVAAGLPLERGGNDYIHVAGEKDGFSADYREITPDYFRTLNIPLLQGRLFTAADSPGTRKVILINATFAREHLHGRSPIGERLTGGEEHLTGGEEIVGVVGDVKSRLNEPAPSTFFVPMAQASYEADQLFQAWFPTCVVIRTAQNPLSLSHAVENALRQADSNLPIGQARSMEEVLSLSIAFQRFLMTLMTVFALLALLLAAVGLYGVIAYSVNQRTHEIGIRIALGATQGVILKAVMEEGLRLTLIGSAAGLAAALAMTRILSTMLFGVKATDPLTLTAASLVLISVATLAGFVPARRASRLDPMAALRHE
jgi:putative ABC transport system permease protein